MTTPGNIEMDLRHAVRKYAALQFLMNNQFPVTEKELNDGVALISKPFSDHYECMIQYNYPKHWTSEMAPVPVIINMKHTVDYLLKSAKPSALLRDKTARSFLLSDTLSDTLVVYGIETFISQSVDCFGRLLNYQRRMGGQELIYGWDKTMVYVVNELANLADLTVLRWDKMKTEITRRFSHQLYIKSGVLMEEALKFSFQVGNKNRFAEIIDWLCCRGYECKAYGFAYDERNAEGELWRCFKKEKKLLFACICCGSIEASMGDHKVCSGCDNVRYCNRDCQKAHWKEHKKKCKKTPKHKIFT